MKKKIGRVRSEEVQIGQELNPHPGVFEAPLPLIPLDDLGEPEPVSEDAMEAMRWASRLDNDCQVLQLARELPIQVVQEQIRMWNESKTAVAASSSPTHKLVVGSFPTVTLRHAVAKRFQLFCDTLGLSTANRLQRGTMTRFMAENIKVANRHRNIKTAVAAKNIQNKLNVREWHKAWQRDPCDGETAVAAAS